MLKVIINLRDFLFILLLLISLQLQAQSTLKNFYPTFQKFNLESKEVKDLAPYFDISECISGDCNGVEGVWLEIHYDDRYGDRRSKDNNKVTAYYTLYKGSFKEQGSIFEGKSITGLIKYFRAYDSKKLEPGFQKDLNEIVQNMDMEEANFTGKFETYTQNGKTYLRRMEGFHRLTRRQKSYFLMASEFVWYEDGVEQMAEVTFRDLDTVPHQKIRGFRNRDESFIAGKINYRDGSDYVGFIYNNRREGTGIFNDQLNPLKKGVWIDDEFTYKMEISIPTFLHEPRTVFSGSEMNLVHDGKTYKGVGLKDPKTNITFFKSTDGKLFYHGFLTEGTPDYLGAYINLQNGPDRKVATFIGTPQRILIGIFENDNLVDGINISQEYEVKLYDGPEEDLMGSTYIRKGRFVNGKLEGCGYLESKGAGHYNYLEGEFKAGEVVGWHVDNTFDNTMFPKHSGIRHSLFRPPYSAGDYEQMKKLEASECIIDQMGGDVTTFVMNMKVDGDYKRREKIIANYDPIVISSIDFSNAQVQIKDLKVGQQVYLTETKQALYFNSYDSASKILSLQGNVYDAKYGRKVFITKKVPITTKVYVMQQIVKKDNVSMCFECAGSGVLSGRRWELVRKKGLRGTKEIGYHGYYDEEGYYHLVHEKVYYSEKCFYCGGTGKNVFKGSKNCYELLQIIE